MKGAISRYQSTGSLSWTNYYTTAGAEIRFNHIEVFQQAGQLRYFVVGSVKSSSGDRMLVAIVDDNGNPLVSNTLSSAAFPHLLGVKGIYLSDGNFGAIGVSSTGFLNTDKRNITIFKLDPTLNIIQSYAYSSPAGASPNDYDTPADVVEGATPNEFFITGACNPSPSVSNALIDMTTGTVIWANQWTTSSKYPAVGADALYDPASSSIWILANASGSHNTHLIREDYSTGTVLSHHRFNPANNCYSYEMKPSLYNPDALVIAGYMPTGSALQPFMLEYDTALDAVLWGKLYPGSNNGMRLYNENNWLKTSAAGPYGYYYNRIMGYNTDQTAYVLIGSDSASTSTENIRLWRDISSIGENRCGSATSSFSTTPFTLLTSFLLESVSDLFSQNPLPIIQTPITNSSSFCIQEAWRTDTPETDLAGQFSISPNPANDQLTIVLPEATSNGIIAIYDVAGRKVYEKIITPTSTTESVTISDWTPGIYLINLEKPGTQLLSKKVVIQP